MKPVIRRTLHNSFTRIGSVAALGGGLLFAATNAGRAQRPDAPTPTLAELSVQMSALQKRCSTLEKDNTDLKDRLDKFEFPTKLVLSAEDKVLTKQDKDLAKLRQDFNNHTHIQSGYAPSGAIRLKGVGGSGEAVFFIGSFEDKGAHTSIPVIPVGK